MFRVLIALSLAIIATAIACGGGGGTRMTVEEYASACQAFGNSFDDLDNFDEEFAAAFDTLEDAVAELKGWNPPVELQEFHRVRVRSVEAIFDALRDTGFLELVQDLEEASEEEDPAKLLGLLGEMSKLEDKMAELEDKMAGLEDEVERSHEELSPATRRILRESDCL